MEKIYYLVHKTKTEDYKNWTELIPNKDSIKKLNKSSITDTEDQITNKNKSSITDATNDQFPGVYFSLITKDSIKKQQLYPGRYVLIFSYKLLEQQNYHINIHDNNGIISETNTYYPWNINDAVAKIESMTKNNNEVVFHDPISMNHCCIKITLPPANVIARLSDDEYDDYLSNSFLPKERISCASEPDMSKIPFYCYLQGEEEYKKDNTNIDETLSSSHNFLNTMAKVCNIHTKLEKTELVKKIKEKRPHFYKKRYEQNIQALKDFTNKNKKIGGSRRKTKRKGKKVNKRKKGQTKKRKRTRKRKQKYIC